MGGMDSSRNLLTEREGADVPTITCPECNEAIWDLPHGHKLAKCWNTEGHADGGTLAFDTMDEEPRDYLNRVTYMTPDGTARHVTYEELLRGRS